MTIEANEFVLLMPEIFVLSMACIILVLDVVMKPATPPGFVGGIVALSSPHPTRTSRTRIWNTVARRRSM